MGQSVLTSPPASLNTHPSGFRTDRPAIVGPEAPVAPYPIQLEGVVQHGFGRGSKDLGCPTANLPYESITHIANSTRPGVYYGYARVYAASDESPVLPPEDLVVLPMVMSLGWNPFYKNERLTAEIHVLHEFQSDFYGHRLKALVLGYIRPEFDYISREALVADIETDKKVSLNSLARPGYEEYVSDPFFDA